MRAKKPQPKMSARNATRVTRNHSAPDVMENIAALTIAAAVGFARGIGISEEKILFAASHYGRRQKRKKA